MKERHLKGQANLGVRVKMSSHQLGNRTLTVKDYVTKSTEPTHTMSVAMDGKDRNGLKLEIKLALFFKF